MSRRPTDSSPTETSLDSPPGHTVISLLLVIHWFCVFIVLSANFYRSALQEQLIRRVLSPYTRLLNFDPNFTPFYLTHGSEDDDDHFVEVALRDAADQPVERLPRDDDWRGGEPHHRYQSLASVMGFFARREDDAICAELARAIGAAVMSRQQLSRVIVRCNWHRAQPLRLDEAEGSNPEDPNAPAYVDTVYEADVWIAEDGDVELLKKSSRREVAPATRDGGTN